MSCQDNGTKRTAPQPLAAPPSAILCADKFCPWLVDSDDPDAGTLAAAHAAEHEGGRRSNLQAARAAARSRDLRHAGVRRLPEGELR